MGRGALALVLVFATYGAVMYLLAIAVAWWWN